MAVLIDTDLFVERERGADLIDALVGDEPRAISVITVSELWHGVHRATGAAQVRRQALVEDVLEEFEAIEITAPVARVHARIWAALAGAGQLVASHDLWIAATALAHGFGVATQNVGDFSRVPGLRVVAPS